MPKSMSSSASWNWTTKPPIRLILQHSSLALMFFGSVNWNQQHITQQDQDPQKAHARHISGYRQRFHLSLVVNHVTTILREHAISFVFCFCPLCFFREPVYLLLCPLFNCWYILLFSRDTIASYFPFSTSHWIYWDLQLFTFRFFRIILYRCLCSTSQVVLDWLLLAFLNDIVLALLVLYVLFQPSRLAFMALL